MPEFESLHMFSSAWRLRVQELREQSNLLRLRSEQLIRQSLDGCEASFELCDRSASLQRDSRDLMKRGSKLVQKISHISHNT